MIKVIVLTAIWILYAVLEGWREAHYFHRVMDTDKKTGKMLHIWWNIQRALVVLVMFITCTSWWVIGLGLMFPFFHDGMYYHTRHVLNSKNYPKDWFDYSTTSTAFLSKFETSAARIVFFILGVCVIVTYLIV